MGTLAAFYVRVDDASVLEPLLDLVEAPVVEEGCGFVGVDLALTGTMEPDHERMSSIARALRTDVVWLSFQSHVDAFHFAHWRAGALVRELAYGCYREQHTWERVRGAAEAWESEALSACGRVEVGVLDTLDAREAARAVASHYNLPGWDDAPESET